MSRAGGGWRQATWSVLEGHPLASDGAVVLGLVAPRLPNGLRLALILKRKPAKPPIWQLESFQVEGEGLSTMEGLASIRRLPPIATLLESAVEVADLYSAGDDLEGYIASVRSALGDADRRDEFLEGLWSLLNLAAIVAPARPVKWVAESLGVHPASVSRWMRERRERDGGN